MATFAYVAKDKAGKIHRGRAEANNEKNAHQKVAGFGLLGDASHQRRHRRQEEEKSADGVQKGEIGITFPSSVASLRR